MATFMIVILVIAAVIFFTTTKTGKRLKMRASGTADEMIGNDASTPDGAKAYYNSIISKKEDSYIKANSLYTQIEGKIQNYETQLRQLQKENMQMDLSVASCIDRNDDESAKAYLAKQQEVADKIETIKTTLKELKENRDVQKENLTALQEEIKSLKAEKDKAVFTLEAAETVKSLQSATSTSSQEENRMLEKVREGVQKTKEQADGTRIAYENSTDIQMKRLDKKMKDEELQKKLDALKAAQKK
ncbi:hypothetical protein LI205_04035 [bacterium MSK18_59]|nr:hypothetical protein [bacterium MSK18_59]